MGLDIVAYKQAKFVREMTDGDDTAMIKNKWICVDSDNYFVNRLDGYLQGYYECEHKGFSFRAGSYSGYNCWKEALSVVALGMTPEELWGNPVNEHNLPFFELIYMSDCEGCIGPKTSRKLAEDFASNRDRIKEVIAEDHQEWFFELYDDWQKAFEIASDDGFVFFR